MASGCVFRQQHEAYIQRLLELQRKAHRTAQEAETAKLLVVLIADYEAKQFTVENASGVEVLRDLMDANGLRQKDLADKQLAQIAPNLSSMKKRLAPSAAEWYGSADPAPSKRDKRERSA